MEQVLVVGLDQLGEYGRSRLLDEHAVRVAHALPLVGSGGGREGAIEAVLLLLQSSSDEGAGGR